MRAWWLPRKIGPTREWREAGSPFDTIATRHGINRVDLDGDPATPDPPLWSRRIGGTLWQQWRGTHRVPWEQLADHLFTLHLRLLKEHGEDFIRRTIWAAHSHAGAGACLALNRLIRLDPSLPLPGALLSLDMPVRRPMQPVYDRLEACYDGKIIHCHSTGWSLDDRFRWLGNRFASRVWKQAHLIIPVEGGHSRFLTRPPYLDQMDAIWPKVKLCLTPV